MHGSQKRAAISHLSWPKLLSVSDANNLLPKTASRHYLKTACKIIADMKTKQHCYQTLF